MTRTGFFWTAIMAVSMASAIPAAGQTTLAQSAPNGSDFGAGFIGQSFTVGTAGLHYDDIKFTFLGINGSNTAPGNLYLFSSPYAGTPSGLTSAGGYLGSSTGSGGFYTFNPALILAGGNKYFAYSNVSQDPGGNDNTYPAGVSYIANDANSAFGEDTGFDNAFRITGVTTAPEPASWALMILGFGVAGVALRRRNRVNVRVAYA